MELSLVLYVGLGGALGSVSRYALTYAIQSRLVSPFPVATLLINVTGSLLLGFVMRYAADSTSLSAETRLLLTTGFCGGYTTFSSLEFETLQAIRRGLPWIGILYAFGSLILGYAAVWFGMAVASRQ